MNNAELDIHIAAHLYSVKSKERDNRIYKRLGWFPREHVTPKVLAELFDVTPQRTHASLMRLNDEGITYADTYYNRERGHHENEWFINEEGLIRFLLTQRMKDQLPEA